MTALATNPVPPPPRQHGPVGASVAASLALHAVLALAVLTATPREPQSPTVPYLPTRTSEIPELPLLQRPTPAPVPPRADEVASPPALPTPAAEPVRRNAERRSAERRSAERRPERRPAVAVATSPAGTVAAPAGGENSPGGRDLPPTTLATSGAEPAQPAGEAAVPPTRPAGCPGGLTWAQKLPQLLGNCLDGWAGTPRPCGAATVLRLTVAANGLWLHPPVVLRGCGDGLADRQVQAAIAACAPLPALPATCRAVEVDVPVRFADGP